MTPIEDGKRTLVMAGAAVATLQMVWMQVRAEETPLRSAEGDAKRDVGEDEPVGKEEVVNDRLSDTALKSADAIDALNAEAVVFVTEVPITAPITAQVAANGGEMGLERNPEQEQAIYFDNAADNEKDGTLVPAEPLWTAKTLTTEAATTESPTELPQPTEPVATMEVTAKPFLRTQDPTIIADAVTNDNADTPAPGYLSQGSNPLVLVALAGICCIFLLLWGRKRRSNATSSPGTPRGASSKGSKVQYTQVPNEQPFGHSQDDDDEYCDDYEEDTFANDRDNWDDSEGNSTQKEVTQLNPFVAPPSAPRPTTPRQGNSSTSPFFKLPQPLPPPQQQHVQLPEIAIASKGDLLPSNVESNSSSESFEVVTDEAHAPPVIYRGATADTETESESVDDLFSQFGMVPTFKKSAVVPPPVAPTSAALVFQPGTAATPSSVSSLPSAAEASALFADEMDDELTAVDAADEWGEDDEWVKGI